MSKLNFPFIIKPKPPKPPKRDLATPPKMGVQLEGRAFSQAQWIGRNSLVKLRVRWDQIEAAPGVYMWSELEKEMLVLDGRPILFQVFGTPKDCRIFPGAVCSAPMLTKVYRLTDFIKALVNRYCPLAIELWNEPEVSAQMALENGLDGLLGGFGIDLAEYYGKVVREVGLMFRQQYCHAWLVAGGLVCDDPNARFWKLARSRCAGYYDAVSFHAYPSFPGGDFSLIERKAGWLRAIKGAGKDKLWVTETAYKSVKDGPEFRGQQAAYFDYVLARLKRWGITAAVWYPLANNGWACTDMVIHSEAMPVWYAYKKATG